MAENYYNGNKVWNHILGGKSYMTAYANGKVVIDSVQKTTVLAYIMNTDLSGVIEIALTSPPASDLDVAIVANYDIYITDKKTGVTTQESRTYVYNIIFQKGYRGSRYAYINVDIPSGYVFRGISFRTVGVTKVTPTSDEVYNYSYL